MPTCHSQENTNRARPTGRASRRSCTRHPAAPKASTCAVVASLGGAPKHPVWYFNITANPHVELQDGPDKNDYLAREVTGDEKAVWWERAIEAWPDYATYQEKTDRQIPVFVLEPMR